MNKDTLINIRVNKDLKDAFQSIIEKEGYTMSDIIESSMRDVVRRGFVPMFLKTKMPRYLKKDIVSIVDIKKALDEIAAKSKIRNVSLIGSYSKGTATNRSDVDLFIETDDGFTLFDLADFQSKMESKLGKKVDVITNDTDEYFMNHIQKEKIQLYERRS